MKSGWLIGLGIALCGGCSSTSTNEGSGGGGGSSSGCADDSVEQAYADSPIMVGCNGNVNQCGSAALCATGWHLCTYAEYVARGGANEKASANRWLAGCVRQYDSPTVSCPAEDENVCGNACASTSAEALNVHFKCDGSEPIASDQVNLGLLASNIQMRPGCDTAECSYVDVVTASAGKSALENFGATCCK